VALDDVDIVEGRLVLFVGKIDFIGIIVNNHDRARVGDDLAMDLADPLKRPRRPVAKHKMVIHFKMRHVGPPQITFDQDRGNARRE
jgi:hypothetical protein